MSANILPSHNSLIKNNDLLGMKIFLHNRIKKINPAIRRLITYLHPHRTLIIFSIFFMIASAASSSLIAVLLGKLTDVGFYEKQDWILVIAPIGLILISILNGGSMFMSNYLLSRVSQSLLKQLRQELYTKIIHWPAATYQNNQTGMIAAKFVNEANVGLSQTTKSAIILVRDSVQLISLIGVLVWHNITLTLVTFVIAPAIVWLLKTISRKIKGVLQSSQQNIASLLIHVKECCEARKVIKIADSYDHELSRFNTINQEVRKLALRMTKISSMATQLIGMAGVAGGLTVAMIQTQAGLLTLGDFITFITAMLLLMPPLRRITGINTAFVAMSVAAESIFATLDTPLEPDNGTEKLNRVHGNVTFRNVTLRYPNTDHDAVHDFNLSVKSGETIALVGTSGSGKTSLVNLLPRFLNPTSGTIQIDGIDTQTVTLQSLRQQIAIVGQDVFLFDGTIRDNIRYGNPDATDEAIHRAVEAAALSDFIASLPQGLDTPVGEAGDHLSGGQKQRLSIARALLKNAPILILDEATSALDAESEFKIKTALSTLMKDRTTFIVAHRLSTVQDADQIVIMQNGEIQEIGTHDQLIQKGGLYAHLCELQGMQSKENA